MPNLLADAPKVRPTVLIATPEHLGALRLTLLEHLADRGAVPAALFSLKLALARKRRTLAAERQRDLLLNLGHKLVDRIAARHVRGLLGFHLGLIVAAGDALGADVRELFELLGIAVCEACGSAADGDTRARDRAFGSLP